MLLAREGLVSRRRQAALVFALLLAVLALAGCGRESTAPPPSYREQARALITDLNTLMQRMCSVGDCPQLVTVYTTTPTAPVLIMLEPAPKTP